MARGSGAASGGVGQLGRRPVLPAGAGRAAPQPRGAGGDDRRRGERRREGAGRGLGPLLHRDGADRRDDDRRRGAERGARRGPRVRPGPGRRRHRPRRPQRGAGAARPGDGEPRRHRPADDLRRDLDRDPRDGRAAAQHLGPGRGDGAGPRRRQRPPPRCRDQLRAAARRPGRDRRPRRDLGGDPALRPRLLPAAGRLVPPARGGPRQLRRAGRRPRALRAVQLPLLGPGAGPGAQPHGGAGRGPAAGPPPTSTTSSSRTGRWGRWRGPARRCRGRSRRSRGWPGGSPPAAARSTAATGSSSTSAASASPRWSTGCRASTAPRRRGG